LKSINQIRIRAAPERVFRAAQDVLAWPRLLSHYRTVEVVDGSISDPVCTLDMAAHRNGFPCRWRAVRTLHPQDLRIHYRHTKSTWTSGMDVWWTVEPVDGGTTEARITHEMPPTPRPMEWFRQKVVGGLFVENIADKTLEGLKRHLERGAP